MFKKPKKKGNLAEKQGDSELPDKTKDEIDTEINASRLETAGNVTNNTIILISDCDEKSPQQEKNFVEKQADDPNQLMADDNEQLEVHIEGADPKDIKNQSMEIEAEREAESQLRQLEAAQKSPKGV